MSVHENPFPPYDHDDARSRASARLAGDPFQPAGAEALLESYRDALDAAVKELAAARNAELDAQNARDEAKRAALLSEGCPKVGVFGGIRTTTAYVKAWVEDQVADLERAYKLAREARRAAADHIDKLGKQGRFQQSITASVRESFRGTNGRQW